jgi:hypothetical protein
MHRAVTGVKIQRRVSYRDTESTDAYMCLNLRANEQRVRERKMENDHRPNLTGPYLSTGIEIDQSEIIILTTI